MRAANEWDVELKTQGEIPYLQATMCYFVYHINTIALFQQEMPTSLMNEKKWINKHRITIVQYISANSQDGKMHWIMIIKNNNGHTMGNKAPTIENCEGLTIHSSTWPRGAKGEQHVSSRLAISNTLEKIVFYHVCCYSFSQNWKSLYNTLVNMTYHLDRGHFFNRSNCSFS